MKYLLYICTFCFCISASAQQLNNTSAKLPISLSLLQYSNAYNNYQNLYDLKSELKPYTFTINQLDRMRRGQFIISSKNINKNFTFLELPTIDLKKELNNIMHKVPGFDMPVRAEGFTL